MLKSTAWKKYATAGNDGSDWYNEYSVKTFNKKYVNLESIILQAKHDQLKSFNAFYQNKIILRLPCELILYQPSPAKSNYDKMQICDSWNLI